MPYYRFAKGDIFHNRIKTYPKVRFDIYGGVVYYNGAFRESGSFTGSVPNVLPGHISLYEMNVDRSDKYNSADSPDLILGKMYQQVLLTKLFMETKLR